jgi:hypothetical protein
VAPAQRGKYLCVETCAHVLQCPAVEAESSQQSPRQSPNRPWPRRRAQQPRARPSGSPVKVVARVVKSSHNRGMLHRATHRGEAVLRSSSPAIAACVSADEFNPRARARWAPCNHQSGHRQPARCNRAKTIGTFYRWDRPGKRPERCTRPNSGCECSGRCEVCDTDFAPLPEDPTGRPLRRR